jgi:hypothetical protein
MEIRSAGALKILYEIRENLSKRLRGAEEG